MNDKDKQLAQQAINFIKKNKTLLIETFANDIICPPAKKGDKTVSIFMAGSPGAGKTEFSKSFLKDLGEKASAVRIDADEIREIIPGYNGSNSHIVQTAASIGVEKLYDFVLSKKKNTIVDGTFAIDINKAKQNIARSLSKGRDTSIYYIYQEPQIAWEFTQAREALEGRKIPKERFIESFLLAQENVNLVKKEFGNKIKLYLIIKNIDNGLKKLYIDIQQVDNYLEYIYNRETLNNLLVS